MSRFILSSHFALFATLIVGLIGLTGCGGDGSSVKLVPVTGKVTADGKPLTVGTVTFQPDDSKGNTSKAIPSGVVSENGTYKLFTDGKEGAPPGFYKVGVSPLGMSGSTMANPTDPKMMNSLTAATYNQRYTMPGTSGISFEVKDQAAAGAYDIPLVK